MLYCLMDSPKEYEYFCVEVVRTQQVKLYFKLEKGKTLGATPNQEWIAIAKDIPCHEWKNCRNNICYEVDRVYTVDQNMAEQHIVREMQGF